MNGEKGEPLSVAMCATPAAGAPTGNQCRSIGAIAARAWSTSARMARARTAAAVAADAQLAATLGAAPEAEPAGQKELFLEFERGRVLVTHVCGSLLIVLIAVPRDDDGAAAADFGLLRRKAAAARTLLEPPLREWVAERARLAAIPLAPQQESVCEGYA